MTIPEWFCEVICGGLNMDELNGGDDVQPESSDFAHEKESTLFVSEEEFHIHRGRVGFDKSLNIPKEVAPGNYKN